MLVLRILIGVGLAYLVLLLLAWLFQDRLAFPAPRAQLPDPKRVGVENGERVELVSGDGTKLVGWYLTPKGWGGGGGWRRGGGGHTPSHLPHLLCQIPAHQPRPVPPRSGEHTTGTQSP